jgi:hypothetical protein
MTKPTGRPRGRPRKEKIAAPPKRTRGRPALPLLEDPNRYAVAALPAICTKYKLNGRMSSVMAVQWFSTTNRPETIRQKARLARAGRAGEKNRNLWKTARWLSGTENLIWVALNFEKMKHSQHITRVMKIAAIWKENRFARETLLPLIDCLIREDLEKIF